MRIRFQLLLLISLTLFCYLPFLKNPFIWDDQQFVTENQTIQEFNVGQMFRESTTAGGGSTSNYFRPLTSLSFAWDVSWWGNNPIGLHLTNLLLHLSAGLLLFWLLTNFRVSGRWRFWITALFLLHPVQTEAVTYISSRGDSLSAVFLLFGVGCFWLSLQKNATTLSVYDLHLRFSKPILLLSSSLALMCAVLAKELALAGLGLYGLVLLLHVFQHRVKIRQIVRRYSLPLITISLLLILGVSYAYLRQTSLNFDPSFDYSVIDPQYPTSIVVRLLTFARALPLYLSTYGFPFLLHMDHTLPVLTNPLNPWTALVVLGSILAIGLSWYELKKQKTVWFSFGATWFLLGLVPVSGIIPVNGLFYEHWLYLPSIGLSICVLAILRMIGAGIQSNKRLVFLQKSYSDFRLYVPGLLLVILFVLTIRQNYLWGDQERFFAYTLRFSQSARLYNNLAMAQADKGKTTQAVENYQKALELSPNYPQIYHNIGNILASQGQLETALQYYLKAIEVDPTFVFSYPKAMMLADGLDDASASAILMTSAKQNLEPTILLQLEQSFGK